MLSSILSTVSSTLSTTSTLSATSALSATSTLSTTSSVASMFATLGASDYQHYHRCLPDLSPERIRDLIGVPGLG